MRASLLPDMGNARYALLCAALLLGTGTAAQETCTFTMVSEPARQVISCGGTLTVEREPGTAITIDERAGNAPPRAIEIEGGAILIDVRPGSAPTQIRTPHAIAAVRGTTYIVDAEAQRTSVFVLAGRVEVRKVEDGSAAVQLRPGQGVDVTATDRLEVKRWGAERAAQLRARFGR